AVRMWSILLAISAIAQRSLAGTLEPTGGRLWRGLSLFPGVRGAAEQARQALAGSAATAGSVAPLRAAVLWLIGAAIVVVVLWATFQLGQGLIWNQWDYRQRKRLLEPATTGDKGGGWAARLALWTAVLTAETFGFGGWPSLAGATGAAALMALVVGGAYRVKSEE
ncbi:MAG: hypothetical protein KGJ86_18480, partial [Chloroflexota bacterium]|nr:hypothetical protein [Chloroflexota bacterium]